MWTKIENAIEVAAAIAAHHCGEIEVSDPMATKMIAGEVDREKCGIERGGPAGPSRAAVLQGSGGEHRHVDGHRERRRTTDRVRPVR